MSISSRADPSVRDEVEIEMVAQNELPTVNEQMMRTVLTSIPLGVCMLDLAGRITFWNQEAERIAGHRAAEITGRRCCDGVLVHLDDTGRELCDPLSCASSCPMLQRKPTESAVYLRHRLGHRVYSATRSIPIVDDDGGLVATALVFDGANTEVARELEFERLQKLALLDSLTHIGNRRYGQRALAATLAEKSRHSGSFGALFVDIDGFKPVNDQHGHHKGDQVLRMVARTLAEGIRLYDFVCRWGGDEFFLILRDVTPEQLGERAEALRRLVRHSSDMTNGAKISVTVSIGATMGEADDDVQQLVGRADWLMYRSKNAGGDRVTFG